MSNAPSSASSSLGLRANARRIAALAIVLPLALWARAPVLGARERTEMAERFAFERRELPQVGTRALRTERPVNPALAHVAGWINVLGAAIALGDLDQDGLCNDVVLSDPRTDEVSVQPVPGTGARYAPFVLDPASLESGPLPHDAATCAPMGCVPCDMNEDGLLDVLVTWWGRPPIAFLRRAGAPLARDAFVARALGDASERWYTNAATFADVDGDGHADLIVGNYFPDGARVLDARATEPDPMQDSMSRALNGGRDRVLLWASAAAGDAPDVAFREAAGALSDEVALGWTLALGAADLDGDLLPEVYVANDFGSDRLLHNRSSPGRVELVAVAGERTAFMPASKVLGHDSFKGMGVDFGDVNGDGRLDIYVSNITTEFGLMESQFLFVSHAGNVGASLRAGVAPYTDESLGLGLARSGWAWDARLADFDGDGVLEAQQALGFLRGRVNRWPELHEIAMGNDQLLASAAIWHRFGAGDDLSGGNASPFFVRARDGRFHDLAEQVGLGQREVRRGIALADVDGDLDLDFGAANQWESSAVYANECPAHGNVLALSLVLPIGAPAKRPTRVVDGPPDVPARAAIGATVEIPRDDSDWPGPLASIGFVDGGNGHAGARCHCVHFGLGRGGLGNEHVHVAWRDERGAPHRARFILPPGRHTIVLGTEDEP